MDRPRDIRIAFIGDSLTLGTGDEHLLGWPARLCQWAQSENQTITCYNLGVRYETSTDMLKRFAAELLPRLQGDFESHVVICCGVNDCSLVDETPRTEQAESVKNLAKMLELAADHPCLVVGPPPVGSFPTNARIEALDGEFESVASANGAGFVSLFQALRRNMNYMRALLKNDGYHPFAAGYEEMAKVVQAAEDWPYSV